ncbi:MAG: hypothetical protein KDB24_07595 [Microthrixaceae bacterium]|nr:hypothetical protein [Microthrixaceae bacterium]
MNPSSDTPANPDPPPTGVAELVMVYDADGGLRGEIAYNWGRLRRTAHCSLCTITHNLVKERRSWADWRAGVGVPVTVLHRNERPPDVESVSGDRTPCVLARTEAGLTYLLGPGELDACDGELDVFERILTTALDRASLDLGG